MTITIDSPSRARHRTRFGTRSIWIAIAAALAIVSAARPARAQAQDAWKSDWSVPEGFALDIHADGFSLPTSLAMVPNPGPNPKDPLYFVTELFGKIKVVTRDGTVMTFAENFFTVHPEPPPPSTWGEIGMAGIALDEKHGYVFVSFLYHDVNNVMRNGLMRFTSKPTVFGVKEEGHVSFNQLFQDETSWVNYQIGPMVVSGDTLFVAVGDGGKPFNSQDLHYMTGKILRMTLDGAPLPDNPFTVDADPKKAQNFIWAYGFRNVFGLSMVDGRLFASENGIQIDRFLEVRKGENYNWDGTDWSIGMNSAMVFGPTVGPVQLAWMPPASALWPAEYRARFYMAMSYGQNFTTGVASLGYDFEKSRMSGPPKKVLIYKLPPGGLDFSDTAIIQKVVGAAFGPDGLYVIPMYPVRKEKGAKSSIFRISYNPAHAHPFVLDKDKSAETLIAKYYCFYCHSRDGEKEKAAPPLDEASLLPRLLNEVSSSKYAAQIADMDKTQGNDGYRELRAQVMEAQGMERVRRFIKGRLVNPKFDRKSAAMPAFNMADADADTIATFLATSHQTAPSFTERIKNTLKKRIGPARYAYVAVTGVLGLLFGLVLGNVSRRRRYAR